MTQPGETDGFKVSNHLKVLMDYGVAEILIMLLLIME